MSDGTELDTRDEALADLAHHPERLPMLPGEVKPHPSPRQYVLIAIVLVVVTAFEVAVSYLEGEMSPNVIIVLLLAMAAVKFFLVASWYMHLKTDLPMFRRVFVVGLVGAGIVYIVVLLTFSVFSDDAGTPPAEAGDTPAALAA